MLRTPVGLAVATIVVLGGLAGLVIVAEAVRIGVQARRTIARAISG